MTKKATELNTRQSLFVTEYLISGNATKAAKAAGYSSPRQQGSRLLSKDVIKTAIEKNRAALRVKNLSKIDLLVAELEKIIDDQALHVNSRLKAIELAIKMEGGFAPEKREISYPSTFLADLDLDTDKAEPKLELVK
jgi:phage terminase small subunit